jgi:putative ABC transport system substrate-binding protein
MSGIRFSALGAAMQRREFVGLLGSASAVWPLAARAQQGQRIRRVGVFMSLAENDPELQARLAILLPALRDLGWMEGRNLRIELRTIANGIERMRAAVAELISLNPDILYATNTQIVQELQRQTQTIPIVFVNIADPVETGVVASLAQPGGNATGFMNTENTMGGKWLQLIKEVDPSIKRVLVLVNSGNDGNRGAARIIESAASSLGVQLSSVEVGDGGEVERAIEAFAREPSGGLIVTPGFPINDRRKLIFALAARYRLPAVYIFRFFVADGGLMSYGPDVNDMFRRSASYVDRILRGEKPGDLPVQAPVKYELVVNLNAAKAIGLSIPESLLVRADEVIE